MAVYRPDPPVRLPAVGIAALLVVAASAPFAAVPQRAAYLRDAPAAMLRAAPVAAMFAPADPAYQFVGPTIQRAAAYQRASTQPWTLSTTAPQAPPASYIAATPPPRAHSRTDAAPWTMWETFATFAPADPAYQFGGPTTQPLAAYLRASSQPWTPAVSTPQTPVVAYIAPPQLPRAHDRAGAAPWTLYETFALYAPADPAYQFSGSVLQSVAAYRREPTPAAPLLVFAPPAAPVAFLPAPSLPRVAYARLDPAPWTMLETFALYAPAAVYQFSGATMQSAAFYRREPTSSQLQASQAIQSPPTAFVPVTRATIDTRDQPRAGQARPLLAALVGVPAPFDGFRGVRPHVPSLYERDRGAGILPRTWLLRVGVNAPAAPVYGTPRFHGIAYDASSRIGSSPDADGSARIGGAIGTKPRRIGS